MTTNTRTFGQKTRLVFLSVMADPSRLVHHGAGWCNITAMAVAEKSIRQSVTLPAHVARRVKSLAKTSRTSANRIIVELIESGIEARQQERKRFLELADRLARSRDVEEQTRLKEELALMTFGE
jgi:predicted DNA-binding protein